MTQVLIVSTEENTLRSEIIGWTHEDISLFVPSKPIGYTPSPKYAFPGETVFEIMTKGWKLLGPPQKEDDNYFSWWFVKD